MGSGSMVLRDVTVAGSGSLTRVTMSGDGWLAPSALDDTIEGGRPVVFVDLPGVMPAANACSTGARVTGVRANVVSRDPLVTRVTLELAQPTAYHAERAGVDGADYVVVFDANAPIVDEVFGPDEIADPSASVAAPPAADRASDFARVAGAPAIDPMSALQQAPAPPAAATVPPQGESSVQALMPRQPGTPRQYFGHPISLDLQGSSLRDVLRLFANISGLTMVIDAAIDGTVVIILSEVPWDQALEIVLRSHNLGYTIDGTVVRIAKLETLRDEETQRAELEKARLDSGELLVRTYALSYARAEEISTMLTRGRILSERGQTVVDPRTNTLIITDLDSRHQTASDLIRGLDRPEPQVEIEARIVQTSRDFARSLGVQWGLNGRMTPEL